MTPLSHPDGRLRELITQWRDAARQSTSDAYSNAFESCADELEALLAAVPVEEAAPQEHAKDIREIVSSYGYLLMRLAVAKDAQDTFDVCKREFEEHEDALKRLQDAFIHNRQSASPGPVAGAVPAPQWQPIESAPKDGTPILAFRDRQQIALMAWEVDKFAKKPRPYWRAVWSFEGTTSQRGNPPTHWMPLPSPPRSEQDETQP